jgi:histidinol dehydrogenase
MCCVPAWVAGVERVAVATPPRADGSVDEAVLAACAIAGADEVYAMGGSQAIAALALGTETVAPVDVVVGPGNRYVQEAKRQLAGRIGIDSLAGPSELMVLLDSAANLDWVALDLCAQAEHADDGLSVAAAADAGSLDEVERKANELAAERSSVEDAPLALVQLGSLEDGVALANALAPEHLELACERPEVLAARIATAGCVFCGPDAATAFGDYVAGSNHVLPTGGAGRFSGPLGPRAFRRPTARVEIGSAAAAELASPLGILARAEGFPVHAESAEARAGGSGGAPKGERP